tara:strand:- start:22 stop:609 length:588 start_codon:yes stop_codon:yes gene_type:complete
MMTELKAHVWWPTFIWQADMSDEQKPELKKVRDFLLNEKKLEPEGVKKTNYGGWQSKTYKEWPEQFKILSDKIDSTVEICRTQIGVPELKLKNFWCNINTFGDYNTLHNHRGSILSGVFYVDVPDENMGKINFERSDDIAYYLPSLENYNNFTGERASYSPETGRFLLFPSWVKHSVDGCVSKKNRISISFNYGV